MDVVDEGDGVGGGAEPVAAVLSRFTDGIEACLVSRLLLKIFKNRYVQLLYIHLVAIISNCFVCDLKK